MRRRPKCWKLFQPVSSHDSRGVTRRLNRRERKKKKSALFICFQLGVADKKKWKNKKYRRKKIIYENKKLQTLSQRGGNSGATAGRLAELFFPPTMFANHPLRLGIPRQFPLIVLGDFLHYYNVSRTVLLKAIQRPFLLLPAHSFFIRPGLLIKMLNGAL